MYTVLDGPAIFSMMANSVLSCKQHLSRFSELVPIASVKRGNL